MDILVVDDDPTLRLLLGVLLSDLGMVRVAEDAATAERAVAERVPDAVVLDVGLPDVDGVTLLREWRADGPMQDVPVVMLTGSDADVDRRASEQAGADAYVTKPYQPLLLSSVVEAVAAERAHQRTLV